VEERPIPANDPILIIGAGIGGLVCAALLAARGEKVVVIEKEAGPGGKVRQLAVDGAMIDAGPTVFTMRDVFDSLFADCGASFADCVSVRPLKILARHAWSDGSRLDLHADPEVSEANIEALAGPDAAQGFRRFRKEAKRLHDALDASFLRAPKTDPLTLGWRMGWRGLPDWLTLRAYTPLWRALGGYFPDPRLRQLFGRYTTYCGSSPFLTPATLMLIAHVEAKGVWAIEGGISALVKALEQLARENGAHFHYGVGVSCLDVLGGRVAGVQLSTGEKLAASGVIFNGDPAALGAALLGQQAARATRPMREKARSLSALVWLGRAKTGSFDLSHHNVFFSDNYPDEFDQIGQGRPPSAPTAYVCALDRNMDQAPTHAERLQIIVNAPANGDRHTYSSEEKELCTRNMLARLSACGLELEQPFPHQLVTPTDFANLFPATGGALYGRASHGWAASFLRPGSRTAIPGLYCAGGATHPGAGVPMAALSGMLASEAILADRSSTRWSPRKDIVGGMSTHSVMTAPTG
jgi:1-hydroxycarotenoid 3,4-desaturase